MTSTEPNDHRSEPAADPAATERTIVSDDALRRLEERLDRASRTAERLIADAAQRAAETLPPAGWQRREAPDADADASAGAGSGPGGEAEILLGILGSLRDRLPPDVQQRLIEAVRELLLALRALIDWCLERSEQQRATSPEVRDIPIL
ncbi:MAG: hypothetical protein WAL63_10550 [Solirubrobacteraceae bacterium]